VTISCSKCRNVPELPEVETVVRSIARIVGRRIVSASSPVRASCAAIRPDERDAGWPAHSRIRRRGKFIVIELDAGHCLVVHLGMTGQAPVRRHARTPYARNREPRPGVLRYEDPRQFGKIEVSRGLPARVEKLGPEPLEITLAEFAARLKGARRASKACCWISTSSAEWKHLPPTKRCSGGDSSAGDRR